MYARPETCVLTAQNDKNSKNTLNLLYSQKKLDTPSNHKKKN